MKNVPDLLIYYIREKGTKYGANNAINHFSLFRGWLIWTMAR